jgi:hypothetical protein
MSSSNQNTSASKANPENLYHIILTTEHVENDPNSETEKIRILGTYGSLVAAKAAAHSCLFDAGYGREWFFKYEGNPTPLRSYSTYQRISLIILAMAPDGTTFRVCINTTPNLGNLTTENGDGRIAIELYHVVQTKFKYTGCEGEQHRDINIEATFTTYDKARSFAHSVLLSEDNHVTKKSFAQYDEAGWNDREGRFGENVVIHAVGFSGENYLISVIKGQAIESVKLTGAAGRAC